MGAGVLGVEPRIEVLETSVIPFHHTPLSVLEESFSTTISIFWTVSFAGGE